MKTLVVYYSRTAITRQVAKKIARKLQADLEEIKDTVNRDGMTGYLKSGKDAMQAKSTTLKPIKKSPLNYDLVVIGTPVWAFNVSTPVRAYLESYKKELKKVAFFCTMGGSGDKKAFEAMKNITGRNPVATASFKTADVKKKNFELKEFIEKIK